MHPSKPWLPLHASVGWGRGMGPPTHTHTTPVKSRTRPFCSDTARPPDCRPGSGGSQAALRPLSGPGRQTGARPSAPGRSVRPSGHQGPVPFEGPCRPRRTLRRVGERPVWGVAPGAWRPQARGRPPGPSGEPGAGLAWSPWSRLANAVFALSFLYQLGTDAEHVTGLPAFCVRETGPAEPVPRRW